MTAATSSAGRTRGVALRNLDSGAERLVLLNELSAVIDVRSGLEQVAAGDGFSSSRRLRADGSRRRSDFLEANISPNLVFNRAETGERTRAAAEKVVPRSRNLRRGQVLVRRGDTVTEEVAETLRVFQRQRQDTATTARVAGIGLVVALLILGWWPSGERLSSPSKRGAACR